MNDILTIQGAPGAAASRLEGPVSLNFPKFQKHFSEFIGIGDNGHLWVEGCDTVELAERFGTPLYVISESQFRLNYRKIRHAFASIYPDVQVLFANKANNGIAYRHIMNQEGAGGDCFGVNELYLSLLAGTDPRKLVLNGSNKSAEEIEMAMRSGLCINIDAMDEIDIIEDVQRRLGNPPVNLGIRVKLELKLLEDRHGINMHGVGSLADQARAHKWGMTFDQTVVLTKRIARNPKFALHEFHYHLSRMSNVPADFAEMAREMVAWSSRLRDATSIFPPYLDLGGGWAFGRPERTGPHGLDDASTPTFDDYAAAVCSAVRDEAGKRSLPLPGLKLEPGWAIGGSAGLSLGRVGAIKEWPGFKKWVNLDLSTNHCPPPWYHHIVAANKAGQFGSDKVDIVGPLCSTDVLGADRLLPPLERGDLVALLDTGAYNESRSVNFNAQSMPAMVLVSGTSAEATTERERMVDVIARFRVPSRLLAGSFLRQ